MGFILIIKKTKGVFCLLSRIQFSGTNCYNRQPMKGLPVVIRGAESPLGKPLQPKLQGKIKSRTLIHFGGRPNLPAMTLNNPRDGC